MIGHLVLSSDGLEAQSSVKVGDLVLCKNVNRSGLIIEELKGSSLGHMWMVQVEDSSIVWPYFRDQLEVISESR